MRAEEAINVLEDGEWWKWCDIPPAKDDEDAEIFYVALNRAISALRAQKTTAKLDRSQWDGCSACASKCCELCVYQNFGGDDWPCNMCRDGFTEYKAVNYCPVCGRPLTEKAWAELERRINGGTTD